MKKSAIRIFVACLLAVAAPASAAAADTPDEQVEMAGLEVAVWKPASGAGPFPLVLFSHGLFGCKTQSNYLMRALAERGMLVAAPDHEDASPACPRLSADASFPADLANPGSWNDGLRASRGKNLRDLRAALEADGRLGAMIDPDRAALVGHSLGGYTVLGLAGGWPAWSTGMGKVTAVVALASFARPLLRNGELDAIPVPVMVQGGLLDGVAPALEQAAVYAAIEAHGCKVLYTGADHFAWTALDLFGLHHEPTARTVAGFLAAAFAGRVPTKADVPPSISAAVECK